MLIPTENKSREEWVEGVPGGVNQQGQWDELVNLLFPSQTPNLFAVHFCYYYLEFYLICVNIWAEFLSFLKCTFWDFPSIWSGGPSTLVCAPKGQFFVLMFVSSAFWTLPMISNHTQVVWCDRSCSRKFCLYRAYEAHMMPFLFSTLSTYWKEWKEGRSIAEKTVTKEQC